MYFYNCQYKWEGEQKSGKEVKTDYQSVKGIEKALTFKDSPQSITDWLYLVVSTKPL